MSDREKLIELLEKSLFPDYDFEELANYLISNGVTVQKWIPVSERLPTEEDANDYESVLAVSRMNRCVREMVWYAIARYPQAFTHWMPTPEPPKECE